MEQAQDRLPCPVNCIAVHRFPNTGIKLYIYVDPLTQSSFSVTPAKGQTLAGQLLRLRRKFGLIPETPTPDHSRLKVGAA